MLRYYYWYVVCAFPVHLARIAPRASLNGSILWSGFGLAANEGCDYAESRLVQFRVVYPSSVGLH